MHSKRGWLRREWSALGPGIVSGAADDDPSGIATYSIAGARFGTSLIWLAVITWPLMAVVQTTCARLGMVSGEGFAGAHATPAQNERHREVLEHLCRGE